MLMNLFRSLPELKPTHTNATSALHALEEIERREIEYGLTTPSRWDDIFKQAECYEPLTQTIVRTAIHHRCNRYAFLGRKSQIVTELGDRHCMAALAPLFSLRHQIETMADEAIPNNKDRLDDLADTLFVNAVEASRNVAHRRDIYRLIARTKHFTPPRSRRYQLAEWVEGSARSGYCIIEKPWWED